MGRGDTMYIIVIIEQDEVLAADCRHEIDECDIKSKYLLGIGVGRGLTLSGVRALLMLQL